MKELEDEIPIPAKNAGTGDDYNPGFDSKSEQTAEFRGPFFNPVMWKTRGELFCPPKG
jgi:hypothetical protein